MSTMMPSPDCHTPPVFSKNALIKGQPAQIECVDILGQTYTFTRGAVSVLALEDEWYQDVRDPPAVIEYLREHPEVRPDLFTFWQRLPELEPRYSFHVELESLAVLSIETYQRWWTAQIGKNTRNMVRKSEKAGVVVRDCVYDDAFVEGMTAIFNEVPVRQGRRFWHFGKDVRMVREQFSRFIDREHLIGAFLDDRMVGFAILGDAGTFCDVGQIIAMTAHRDKAIPNALIASSVHLCERQKWPYLVYAYWTEDSLASFKRHSGFSEMKVPRYFVPLSVTGRIALQTRAHRGWKAMLPRGLKATLKRLRSGWYARRGH